MNRSSDTLVVDAHSGIHDNDIIRVGVEYMKVASVNTELGPPKVTELLMYVFLSHFKRSFM